MMGDGVIELKKIRGWVEDAGFKGDIEVEIFSNELWQTDQHAFIERITKAYLAAV